MSSNKRVAVPQSNFWSPLRVVCTIIVLGLLAALGISSCNSSNPRPTSTTPASTNPAGPAAGFATLPVSVTTAELRAADGATIKLSNYSGKVLLVNLWATWCGPCQMETPELVKLHKEYQSRGVEMVGLSTENPDASAEKVRSFVRAFNIDYPIGWATPDVALTLMQGHDSIPQSFVIARDGRIVRRFIGFRPGDQPSDTPQQLRRALEDALKG